MTYAKERLVLGLLVLILPISLYFLSVRPALQRMQALHQRIA